VRNEVLYVGIFKLPDRNAAAVRAQGVADALSAAGYTVRFIDETVARPLKAEEKSSPSQRLVLAGKRGVDYFVTASSYFKTIRSIDWRRIAAVICYPGSAALILRLMHHCRKNSVPLIIDSTEWYDPSHTSGGRFGPFALDSEFRMRWLHRRVGNVICISSFLAEYYGGEGCNVVRIPPLVSMAGDRYCSGLIVAPEQSTGHLSLVYAGFPGRKELFSEIVDGVRASRQHGIDVSLQLVGVTESESWAIMRRSGDRVRDFDGVICHGWLPREAAVQIIAASDFTVLLRPQKRFANAGFPSKLVESLSLGVPVIANATSDIAEYLRDGGNGYLLSEPTAGALEGAIVRASRLTIEQKNQMRIQARLSTHECFDYRNYVGVLAEFLSTARQCG
jgi:glycosyltransferase involved in cell wall biosynthesis